MPSDRSTSSPLLRRGERGLSVVDVLVVADVRLYREGLSVLLRRGGAVSVAGAVVDAAEALEALDRTGVDVVLMDGTAARGAQGPPAVVGGAAARPAVSVGVKDEEDAIVACAEAGVA